MRTTLLALAAGAVLAGGLALPATAAHGLDAAGLAAGGKKITTFSTADGVAAKAVALTGLRDDKRLVGMDYRAQDGALYGVGDEGGLYVVDPTTGAAAFRGQLSVPLDGGSFGVDFNPTANALRIVSDTGQNLRQPFASVVDGNTAVTAATVVDGALNYAGVPAQGVTAAAYTNNDADCTNVAPASTCTTADGRTGTTTTLLDIDTALDQVALQSPPNSGTLSPRGVALGVDASDVAGFDIYSTVVDGQAVTDADRGFALLTVGGERQLYAIDVTTGAASFLTGVTRGVSDIAVATRQ